MDWSFDPRVVGSVALGLLTLLVYFVFIRKRRFLNKDEWKALKLIEKETLTHNTRRYRFALPGGCILGLPVGQHISFKYEENGREVLRSYTPVTGDEESGYVDFVIKVYPGGKMSQHVDRLRIGNTLMMRGPKGRFTYTSNMKKSFGMIAGGTGITPMYQIAREVLKNKNDRTTLSLVFGNVSIDDILVKEEIDKLAERHPDRFRVYYVLDRAPEGWTGGVGYITPDMIRERCPAPSPDSMLLFCGPPVMVKTLEAHALHLGYAKDQYHSF